MTAPPQLPPRDAYVVGACWPLPDPVVVTSLPHLELLVALHLTALRVDIHPANTGAIDLLIQIATAGLRPWPIVRTSGTLNTDIGLAVAISEECPWITDIDLENEPSARMSMPAYADFVATVSPHLTAAATRYLACECYDFTTGQMHSAWTELQALVDPNLFEGLAIHNYRNPKPYGYSAWGTRAKEWDALRALMPGKALAITEFGWQGNTGVDVTGELEEDRYAGCLGSCIYAYIDRPGGWGLYEDRGDGTWHESPMGTAVKSYLAPTEPPPPVGPLPPVIGTKIAVSEPVSFLNWRWGGGQSLTPPTHPEDANRAAFEHGRTVAGPDELCTLTSNTDGTYSLRSPNGRSWLSIQADGSFQERDARDPGQPGPWERFTLASGLLTELPKDGITRPPAVVALA